LWTGNIEAAVNGIIVASIYPPNSACGGAQERRRAGRARLHDGADAKANRELGRSVGMRTSEPLGFGELFMRADFDLAAVVYDPPAPGLPHMAVLFDGERAVIAVQPVESIDAGKAALAHLVGELVGEQSATA